MLVLLTPAEVKKYNPFLMSMMQAATPIPAKQLPKEMREAVMTLVDGSKDRDQNDAEDCLGLAWAGRLEATDCWSSHDLSADGEKEITLYVAGPGQLKSHPWILIGGPLNPQDLAPVCEAIDWAGNHDEFRQFKAARKAKEAAATVK